MTESEIELERAAMLERTSAEKLALALSEKNASLRDCYFDSAAMYSRHAREALERAMKLDMRERYPRAFAY